MIHIRLGKKFLAWLDYDPVEFEIPEGAKKRKNTPYFYYTSKTMVGGVFIVASPN